MKPLISCLIALLFGFAAGSLGHAAQNTAPGNYRIDAAMTQGGALLQGAAEVYVLDAQGNVVARRHAVPAVFDLGDGDYRAAIVYKNAQARGAIQPGTEPGTNALNLEAGHVRLDLVKRDGTRSRAPNLSWTVYRYRPGSERGQEVATSQDRRPDLTLDAGWYEVYARYAGDSGGANTGVHVIEIKPGRRQSYSIVID